MNSMNNTKTSSYSLMSFFRRRRSRYCKPAVNFQNSIDKYRISIAMPESQIDELEVCVKAFSITFHLEDFHHKIGFSDMADTTQVKTWYEEGMYRVEIPKQQESLVERLNRLSLNYV